LFGGMISNFFGLSITEETLLVEIRIWCIKIGIVLVLHELLVTSNLTGSFKYISKLNIAFVGWISIWNKITQICHLSKMLSFALPLKTDWPNINKTIPKSHAVVNRSYKP
jgi:hypothetical protein